jgi:hypothetical protein
MGIGAKTGRWNKFAHLRITKAIKAGCHSAISGAILFRIMAAYKRQKFDARQHNF